MQCSMVLFDSGNRYIGFEFSFAFEGNFSGEIWTLVKFINKCNLTFYSDCARIFHLRSILGKLATMDYHNRSFSDCGSWKLYKLISRIIICPHFQYPQGEKLSNFHKIEQWQFHVAGVLVFLVWLELMMLVGRFPIFGLYVQMFTTGKNYHWSKIDSR